jgi:hypothetical protein
MRGRWFGAGGAVGAALLVCSSAFAAEPWVGRWAVSPSACGIGGSTPMTAALVVNDTSLNWYSGHCRIGKMYKLGQAAYIEARCFDASVPVTLEPRGDRMRVTWNRAKAENLQRCK